MSWILTIQLFYGETDFYSFDITPYDIYTDIVWWSLVVFTREGGRGVVGIAIRVEDLASNRRRVIRHRKK